jgi:hypothetical protein
MKKKSDVLAMRSGALIFTCAALLASCVSMGVSRQGAAYFAGKKESDLVKYFGYAGKDYDESAALALLDYAGVNRNDWGEFEYDRITYFSNFTQKYEASKTTTQRYKSSKSTAVYNLVFIEYEDGCIKTAPGGQDHYTKHLDTSSNPLYYYYTHNKLDSAVLRNQIAAYNNDIRRLNAVPAGNQQARFDRSNIGDRYFTYSMEQKTNSLYMADSANGSWYDHYTLYGYKMWQVDVIAKEQASTERKIIGSFNGRTQQFYDANGSPISGEEMNAAVDTYTNGKDGFKYTSSNDEGLTMLAYIKGGQVVKVLEVNR